MIDAYIRPLMDPPLTKLGKFFVRFQISANMVTGIGFLFGVAVVIAIMKASYTLAGIFFVLNRLCDGVDGGIARASHMSDLGGYLDIVSDFIIYPAIPLAFAFSNPQAAIYAAYVIFGMSGAMTSFLAYAIICEKRNMHTTKRGKKSFYFLGGICEGFETAVFLGSMCFFPGYFPELAMIFGTLCLLTTLGRVMQAKSSFGN